MVPYAGTFRKRDIGFEVLKKVMRKTWYYILMSIASKISVVLVFVLLTSCDDMLDKNPPVSNLGSPEPTVLFILSEGLFNMNNSTLAKYNLTNKDFISDFFLASNQRGLGDTGNDIGIYGSKLYIVVNVSSQLEVVDIRTGKSLAQIGMFNEKGVAREPRQITFYEGKAYVCSFDGSVAKVDTSTLKVEAVVECGKNPDGICIANNKIYVSNSGGLNFPNYDNTVSVVDITAFKEIKKITVGKNPGKIKADNQGDVYVVTRGDYGALPYGFHKIDSKTDALTESFNDIQPLNFDIRNDTAYLYSYDFNKQTCWVKVFDCKTEKIISNNFISDGTMLHTPYGIDLHPTNGDVYLTDANSYSVLGDVLCFDRKGILKFRINQVGLNPNKVVFSVQ